MEAVLLLSLPITHEDVLDAARQIRGVTIRTPVVPWGDVRLKAENRQLTGSFKIRGAYNAVSRLSDEQLSHGVIAISSGNHAQAVAKAAQLMATTAVVAMPSDSSAYKRSATEALGAEIVEFDRFARDREDVLRELLADTKRTFIPPYDHPHVMAGQGTAALELIEETGELDVLVVPVSGGGLISGCGTIAKHLCPDLRLVGVEPEAANDTKLSLDAGERIWIEAPRTIADGLRTQIPGELTFEVNRRLVDELVLVSDDEIREAMAFLRDELDEVVEPSGAVGVAALRSERVDVSTKRVGVILSGGNVSD